jgi:hypothetical protein
VEILGISYDTDRHAMEKFRELNEQTWPTSFTGGFPAQDPVGRLFHEPDSGVFYLVASDGRLAAKLFGVGALEEQLSKLTAASQARTGIRP